MYYTDSPAVGPDGDVILSRPLGAWAATSIIRRLCAARLDFEDRMVRMVRDRVAQVLDAVVGEAPLLTPPSGAHSNVSTGGRPL
jgi:hypothetical protein